MLPTRSLAAAAAAAAVLTTMGGAHAGQQGVTPHEITVVLYNDLGVEGDMNAPYSPDQEVGNQIADYEAINLVKTIKAQLRWMRDRFDTHGRVVRVLAQAGSYGAGEEARRSDADVTQGIYAPFAAVALGGYYQEAYVERVVEQGIMAFSAGGGFERAEMEEMAPYVWTLGPDRDTEIELSASYLCDKLIGRPARLSPDPLLQQETRKLALLYGRQSQRGPEVEERAIALRDRVRARCGYEFDAVETFLGSAFAGTREAASIFADLRTRGITTIVCYCFAVASESTVSTFQTVATATAFLPEWYWDGTAGMDKQIWHQLFGSKVQRSFGMTPFWRLPEFTQTEAYRAYVDATRDGSAPNARFNSDIHHSLRLLFTAIEAAGSHPSPGAVSSGMTHVAYRNPDDPWRPTGGHEASAVSRYSFVDTAMAWTFDPFSRAPGERAPGCLRVAGEGRRSYAGGWPAGDGDLGLESGPCTAPHQKLFNDL